MTSLIDIFGIDSADWMNNEARNCAIPDEFSPEEIGAIADQWFPTELGEIQYAKRLCKGCPVQTQCFQYAYEDSTILGIWGGTSTAQRIKLRNQKKAGDDAA